MSTNDKPRFDTCTDDTGQNAHTLESAWGRTWCECDHTCIVNYVNNRGGVQLDEDMTPQWWRQALSDRQIDDFDTAWEELEDLHASIAADQSTWDRWDEFSTYWTEERLRALETAGIARIVVTDWDYQDYHSVWHSGAKCGCTTVEFELLTAGESR
jgi:hypothetical protein